MELYRSRSSYGSKAGTGKNLPGKALLALLFSGVMTVLSGCGDAETGEHSGKNAAPDQASGEKEIRLTVFAAASLTETLTEIGKSYEKLHPGVRVVFSFDSSGTLRTQIAEGALCDIFVSASPKQMDALDIRAGAAKNPKGLDYIDGDTRFNLLENKVVLAVSQDSKKVLKSFDDLAAQLREGRVFLAIGNSDVPVGQYTLRIFDYYHLDVQDLYARKALTLGSNVKEVTAQVSEGTVDAGIVYATDAASAGLKTVDTATPEMAGQVIYPAAALKKSQHSGEARIFLDYLKTPESVSIFERVGFTVIGKKQ
ncbi:molybdate ABC transporter substrate-binding protein [Succinimonas amylolytica]|uniref:molybdate ABC transporter substrate-binding protein n=1 Tax=Succinimonas amylolytica TaxID=83769 RepID=UPI000A01BDFC|nr:molybdate ABC transporter substrate-binding protein [Succinimonas amylolytica]